MATNIDYSIVVPLYNEEEVIAHCYTKLSEVMSGIEGSYEIVFVNDGSKDRTMEIAKEIAEKDIHIKILSFSRNFGHQSAITAGMNNSLGDAIVALSL